MPHIALSEGVPGIVDAFAFHRKTAQPMREVVEIWLRGPGSLSRGTRGTRAVNMKLRRLPAYATK